MAMRIIAAYDISNDNRRARLAARFQRWGDRVQKSVFVLTISADELQELQAQAQRIIDLDRDSVLFWHQCTPCQASAHAVGQTRPLDKPRFWAIV